VWPYVDTAGWPCVGVYPHLGAFPCADVYPCVVAAVATGWPPSWQWWCP